MKWFKHDSSASIDAKMERLIMMYGIEGYGLYFYCLEMIARTVEKHNLTFELEHDAELIASRLGIGREKVQDMMTYMVSLGLFENDRGVITCLKMATRTDEYTQKLLKEQGVTSQGHSVPTMSRQCPDSIPTMSELKEEIEETEETPKTLPVCIPSDWMPNSTNLKWMNDSGVPSDKQREIVREFRDFWILTESKKSNWQMAFRRNPMVKRMVNTAKAKPVTSLADYAKGAI